MRNNNTRQPFDPATVALEASNLIEASAGTGKTYSIAILTLRLVLEKKIPLQAILMVTFTKAAVAELETRIRQFMRNALKVSQGALINDETITSIVKSSMTENAVGAVETERLLKEAVLFLDETEILTIHSFCQRILTAYAFETSQVFGSEILTDIKSVITDRVNAFWRKYITTLNTGILQELIEAGLTRNGLVKLLENALSGKTITPDEQLPDNFLSPQHQAALQATTNELATRKATIHNEIDQYILSNRDAIKSATEKNNYAKKNMLHLVDTPAALQEAIIGNRDKVYVSKVYPEILLMYEKIISVDAEKTIFLNTLTNQIYKRAIEIITNETERYKQQKNELSFDDMVTKLHTAVVIDNNDFLIESLRVKYKAAFIDEFQDTDKMQYEIFNSLFGHDAIGCISNSIEAVVGGDTDHGGLPWLVYPPASDNLKYPYTILFYIGDPKQSIFAWRKADLFTYFKAADAVKNNFGMEVNYRSTKKFIEAMNRFFLPVNDFDTFYFSGESHTIDYTNVTAPAQSIKGELYKDNQPDIPITIFETKNDHSINQAVVAQVIQLLDGKEYTINEKEYKRNVRPADIGILVRTNKQARFLKLLLSKYGIPSVTIDDSKLFQSAEARMVLYLLTAVIDINSSAINKALLSPLTGFDANDILVMDDELALNRFRNYQHLWENEGVYVMLTKFIAEYKVKEVLLNEKTANGERIITNTLQLMEVLHKIQTQKQFSSTELANWLKRGIDGMEVQGDEFEQRIESDEEAVKIVTIHKSKGLEYNIVIAPFLDLPSSKKPGFVTFRDATSGDYLFSEKSWLTEEQVLLNKKQEEQENRRLVYVAITRAVYKCYICRNTHYKPEDSSIASFVDALKENRSPLISFEVPLPLPDNYKYSTAAIRLKHTYLQATNFELMEFNWRKLSYTYLDTVHASTNKSNSAKGLEPYDEFIFKVLKRGANTGNLLHYIFERIDFTDTTYWEQVITNALKRFMPDPPVEYSIRLLELLHHVTEVKLQIGDVYFSLSELSKDKRINELEFDFNVAPFNPDAVNRLSTRGLPFQLRYARELEGIMNGKIDLFFEHAGKYFILDWKSNFLGDRPADYARGNIELAMAESNYHLQYLIYTLAVKKYCTLRIPGFEYDKHFGGVIYLFVRGIRKDGDKGIFAYKPAKTLIDRLDELLSKEVEVE